MKTLFTSLSLMLMLSITLAQTANKNEILDFADQMPAFPGGQEALSKFLQQNLRYPSAARQAGFEGKIFTQFVVNDDGSVSDIKIIKGIDTLGFNEEVIRVLNQMPKWSPGKQSGRNVSVYFNLPVSFQLEGDKGNRTESQVLNGQTNISSENLKITETTDYVMNADGRKIYTQVEVMPEYTGGEKELINYLVKNLRYPADARENGITGTVVAQFTVNTDGSVTDITIKNSLLKSCDEEVIRIIKMMPNWKSGVKDGVPVPVIYVLPVSFKLGK